MPIVDPGMRTHTVLLQKEHQDRIRIRYCTWRLRVFRYGTVPEDPGSRDTVPYPKTLDLRIRYRTRRHFLNFNHGSWTPLSKIYITKTCLYNFDPLKPHFYIVKLGFTGVYIIFLISTQKYRLWVLIRTASHNICF